MTVFITDSSERYHAGTAENRILLDVAVIRSSTFLSEAEILALNTLNGSSEITAGDAFVAALEQLVSRLSEKEFPVIPFMEHKTRYEQLYSFLFHRLSEYGRHRFQLHYWIASFLEFQNDPSPLLNFDLDYQYSWIAQSRETLKFNGEVHIRPQQRSGLQRLSGELKNLLHTPYRLLHPPKKAVRSRTNVLIVTYNIPHHIRIFEQYVNHTLKTTDYDIHFLIVSSSLNSSENLVTPLFGEHSRIHIHAFESFRSTHFLRPGKILGKLAQLEPELAFLENDPHFEATFTQYQWMANVFRKLSPDVCLLVNLHEIGRIMADIAWQTKTPSIQVDYGLFSDHHLMNARIAFTARAVLSQAVTAVWEKRGDTALSRIPIGFTKLDDSRSPEELTADKQAFFNANGLDPDLPTVFFASTWSLPGEIYDVEKSEIVKALSGICGRSRYNLIVKKHPLEQDDSLEKLVAGKSCQRIFQHTDLSLEKAIALSDFVTTQGSSIVLEALFYGKMPVFLGIAAEKQHILAGMTNNDDVVYFSDFTAFEQFLQSLVKDESARIEFDARVQQKTEQMLYKKDRKASFRLFELVEKLMKE